MDRKEDRRIRKTKKALREGLAELLMEKNIQNITVRELTDKADVHRSTFYANFKDIYDLYKQVEDVVIQEVSDILFAEYNFDTKAFFGVLFRYIADNKSVCRLVFGGSASSAFFNRISNLIQKSCVDCWRGEYNLTAATEAIEPYARFFISGSLGVIGEWATSDFERPAEGLMVMLADIEDSFRQFVRRKFA
ncbi:MAG: TetR/AcrR family transcriptional regulator [Oscillospiraceae bacterium]|nr:TetR/AcrR family transcriptional regulator [Oscillospiraceae bacterium]